MLHTFVGEIDKVEQAEVLRLALSLNTSEAYSLVSTSASVQVITDQSCTGLKHESYKG